MTPTLLAIIGAFIATFSGLWSALRISDIRRVRAQLVLSIPLLVTAAVAYISPDRLLTIWGHRAADKTPISVTLQYDQPEQGIGIIESVLRLEYPYAKGLTIILITLSLISLFSVQLHRSRKRDKNPLLGLSTGAWFLVWFGWLSTHLTTLFIVHSGESGVRNFIKWSALDIQRVSRFVIPNDGWYYISHSGSLVILSILSALLLTLSAFGVLKTNESPGRGGGRWYHLGALLCLIATIWMSFSMGFHGSQRELTMWLSAIVIGSASSSHLPKVSQGTVAMFALLMLLSGAY